MLTPEYLKKVATARCLLPDPGPKVVGELVGHITQLTEQLADQILEVNRVNEKRVDAVERIKEQLDQDKAKVKQLTSYCAVLNDDAEEMSRQSDEA